MDDSNPIALIFLLLVIMLMAIAVSGWLKRNWQLSITAGFVLIGFIVLNAMALMVPVPTLNNDQLQHFATYVLLPIILSDAAYHFNIYDLRHQPLRPMFLLLPVFIVALAFAFLFLLWRFNGYSEMNLLMVAAASLLLFITDLSPSHKKRSLLNSIDKYTQDKTRCTALVQVESLVISVLALMLFLGVSRLTGMNTETEFIWPSVSWYWLYWLWALLGGVVFGFIWGVIGGLLTSNIKNHRTNLLLLSVISWLSYLSCQHYFGVSGIMSLLTTMLIMNKAHNQFLTPREIRYIRALFRNVRFIAGVVIYGLLIYKLQLDFILNHWLNMLLAVVIFVLARAIAIYGFLPLMTQISGSLVPATARQVLFLSTSHSSLILLAVWLLPADIPAKDSYEAMAMALVLFSLFVQHPNVPKLLRQLTPQKPLRRINLIKTN